MWRPRKSDPVFSDLDNKVKYILVRSCLSPSGYRQLRYFVADFFISFSVIDFFVFCFWWAVPPLWHFALLVLEAPERSVANAIHDAPTSLFSEP